MRVSPDDFTYYRPNTWEAVLWEIRKFSGVANDIRKYIPVILTPEEGFYYEDN